MSMYRSLLAWVSLLALSVAALPHQESQCSEVTFAINAEAQNALYTVTPDPNNETDIVNFVEAVFSGHVFPTNGTQTVGGTFSINGIFCRPNIARHDAVLEILVHGITYNKTYWSGLGFGDYYNWQSFSSSRGYYSLAIDRLGHGTNAQHPDPCVLVEGALQIEIMHQLIGIVRSNAHSVLGQRFQKIAFVSLPYIEFYSIMTGQSTHDRSFLIRHCSSPHFDVYALFLHSPVHLVLQYHRSCSGTCY